MPKPPEAYARLVQRFAATPSEPAAGQVWRARWGSTADVVLLLGTGDSDIRAVPLSFEVEFGDETAVLLAEDEVPFDQSLLAWLGLTRDLPVRVLDVLLGSVDPQVLEGLPTRPGNAPIVTAYDERAQVRDAIAERMEALEDARWLPEGETVDIAELARGKGLTPSAIATQLGEPPGYVTSVLRGDRSLSEDQAATLAPVFEVDTSALLSASVSDDLVWALDRPALRRRLETVGRSRGITDDVQWRRQVATKELATAARVTQSQDPRQRWLGLIEDYLRANGA